MPTKSQIETARMNMRLQLMNAVEEDARKDYAFASAGQNPLKFTVEQQKAIKDALVYYSRNAASRAFDHLTINSKLSEDLPLK